MGLFDDNKYVASLSSAKVVKKVIETITSEQTLMIEQACNGIPEDNAKKVLKALSDGKITPSNFDATLEKLNELLVKDNA